MMCDEWKTGERTYVEHLRYCWPRTSTYVAVMVTLIFIVMVLEIMGVFRA